MVQKLLSLVVPVFNEATSVEGFLAEVDSVLLNSLGLDLEIIFVNDGSSDDTLEVLQNQISNRESKNLIVVDLSRNFGKEAALSAGMKFASGDAVVPVDIDLQDPLDAIVEMVALWNKGFEVVLAHRTDRRQDSIPKRVFSRLFYRIHNVISSTTLPPDVGDFRLMDRVVVDAVLSLPENQRFMKGLFAWVGFKTATLPVVRGSRSSGQSKFNFWRLWNLAIDAATSFSTAPLRVWTYVGGVLATASFVFATFILLRYLMVGIESPGYASIIVTITLLGGLQLLGLGVIGEYLGRTFLEAKRRPSYIVRNVYKG